MKEAIIIPDNFEIVAADFTDDNWKKGIGINKNLILLESNNSMYAALIGMKIECIDGRKVMIKDVQYVSKEWTHILLNEKISFEEGAPYKININCKIIY